MGRHLAPVFQGDIGQEPLVAANQGAAQQRRFETHILSSRLFGMAKNSSIRAIRALLTMRKSNEFISP